MATVTDVEVANASFPTVRQDLNDILEAIATNFSADAEPTTTYPNQWWYETDTNKLYIRNEANDAWIHVLTLDQTTDVVSSVEGVSADAISEGNSSVEVVDSGTGYVQINVDGSEVARLDATGLGIGTTSPDFPLEIYKASTSEVAIGSDNGGTAQLSFYEGDSGTKEFFVKYDGLNNNGVIGTSGSSSAMVIARDSGNVGIGTSSPLDKLDVVSTGNNFSRIRSTSGGNAATLYFQNSDTGTTSNDGTYIGITAAEEAIVWNTENTVMRFGTNNSERMRISSTGQVVMGTSFAADGWQTLNYDGNAYVGIVINNTGIFTAVAGMRFKQSGTTVGQITIGTSSTSYVTTSDYRVKENVVDMTDAIDRVKALKPSQFNFIADPDQTVDGFIAHEVQDVVPEAVTGEKDAMMTEEYEVSPALGEIFVPATGDADEQIISSDVERPETLEEGQQWRETIAAVMGTREVPDYQGIDQSKLVPLLTGALKEAIAKIEALEARVSALES